MKAFLQFVLRSAAAFTATGSVWLVSFFAFEQVVLWSTVFALAGGTGTYYSVKQIQTYRYAKSNGLTWKEYKFISTGCNVRLFKFVGLVM